MGIARRTLIEWIRRGLIPAPPVKVSARGYSVRHFSPRDIAIIMNYKKKNFRKGRGRRRKGA